MNSELEINLSMGGGGVNGQQVDSWGSGCVPDVQEGLECLLIPADMGPARRDEWFIPNLHNGLFRIMAYLRQHGCRTSMVSTDVDNMEMTFRRIGEVRPPLIGFSPYYNTMARDLENIERVRQLSPESLIVVGGFEASLNSQWQSLGGLVDVIVYGEGELPLLALIKGLQHFRLSGQPGGLDELKRSLAGRMREQRLPGIRLMSPDGDLYFQQGRRIPEEKYREITLNAFIDHLHESPIQKYWDWTRQAYDGKKELFFRFVSSDHCPWKCTFCQSSVLYAAVTGSRSTGVRRVEADDIVRVIKHVGDTCSFVKTVYIDDENFVIDRRRAMRTAELVREARRRGEISPELKFISRARTSDIRDDLCSALREAGWVMLSVGSESYSQPELDFMHKGTTPEVNLTGVKTILRSGLAACENYILFTPVTTPAYFLESATQICRNVTELGVDGAATLFITPLPGTPLWNAGDFVEQDPPGQVSRVFPGRKAFRNTRLDYLAVGESITLANGRCLAHPEIILPRDEVMQSSALDAIDNLLETIARLGDASGARESIREERWFISVSHLAATADQVFSRVPTAERSRWRELKEQILTGTRRVVEARNARFGER